MIRYRSEIYGFFLRKILYSIFLKYPITSFLCDRVTPKKSVLFIQIVYFVFCVTSLPDLFFRKKIGCGNYRKSKILL
ncbi:hypothetical protein LEP1GSC186_3121 [Leptospira noguchii serovar Autumnalis str. ZUN142]|uniref:Uncharacterized protein n=1 Tax=Leptospira noguchii serovar Autumnalis str. ZUN142 TaxID=1085540 RepID=M6U8W1_9LEPT|nr:hypothetical protein LEP1GSC186_3121 [Leptospira noguchii serovar Autumnalis str. ZUN142]